MSLATRLPDQLVRTTGQGCLFVLDDEGVFFSVARQELYVFNTPATLLWCCVEEGLSTDAMVLRYSEVFEVGAQDARDHIAMALDQWWGLGYIEAPEIHDAPAASFTTALARLLTNDALRVEFAHDAHGTARRLHLDGEDMDALLRLDAASLEAQAQRLRDRTRRRDAMPRETDTLFSAVVDDDRTVLEFAVEGRLRRLVAAPIERHYRMLDTRFRVRYSSAAQECCVRAALGHLEIQTPAESDVLLDIVESNGVHVILHGLIPVGHARQLDQLAPSMKNAIAVAAVNRHRIFLQLHAGVVSSGDRCILLPGASGSGKTTLTAGLVGAGFTYLSDEVALLEEETLDLRPFPLAIGVKRGAVAAVAERWPQVGELQAHARIDGEYVRYLALPSEHCAPPDSTCTAGWLIFPRYGAELSTALRPITRPQALRRLMQDCMVLPQLLDEARVEKLVQWMRGLQCFELPMNSLTEAVELVKQQCLR